MDEEITKELKCMNSTLARISLNLADICGLLGKTINSMQVPHEQIRHWEEIERKYKEITR